jgi:hypothetical protein
MNCTWEENGLLYDVKITMVRKMYSLRVFISYLKAKSING